MTSNSNTRSITRVPWQRCHVDEAFYAVVQNTQTSVKKIYNYELTNTKNMKPSDVGYFEKDDMYEDESVSVNM